MKTCRIEERTDGLFVVVDNADGRPASIAATLDGAYIDAARSGYSVSYVRSGPVTEPLVVLR